MKPSRVTVTDDTGREHVLWLKDMKLLVEGTGSSTGGGYGMTARITGVIVADPTPPNRNVVNQAGHTVGQYREDERWERQR